MVGAEERERARVQTDGRIYRPAVTVLKTSELKIWSFHVVVEGQERNVQKNVMHVQSCRFAH